MTKSRHKLLLAGALFLFGTTLGMRPPALAADNARPIVHTAEGPVQGYVKNGISEFLGIPYATPPVGDLRWQPPKAHAAWTETLKAT
jgi:para-nitrobenzyl esterase